MDLNKVRAVVEGSITDLSRFADGSFDAAICTGGKLSHVEDAAEGALAACELVRGAKPGALANLVGNPPVDLHPPRRGGHQRTHADRLPKGLTRVAR